MGLPLISFTVMRSLNVLNVSLNKLLNKPSYEFTVMDDLALGGASLLSAHCLAVYHADINSSMPRKLIE